jgi:hypothetical protein
MCRSTKSIVTAGAAAVVWSVAWAHPAAACFRHTFEPCPEATSSAYVVEVDRKTGRTWIKDRPANVEEMAMLAAKAAKQLKVEPVAATDSHDWHTRVDAAEASAPRQN